MLLWLIPLGIGLYLAFLLIKVLNLLIEALNIYITKNTQHFDDWESSRGLAIN